MKELETIIKEKAIEFFGNDIKLENKNFDYDDIIGFSQMLEGEEIIDFTIEDRNRNMDFWLQAETYANTKDNKGLGMIFDYDVAQAYDNIDIIIDDFVRYQNQAMAIQRAIKNVTLNIK